MIRNVLRTGWLKASLLVICIAYSAQGQTPNPPQHSPQSAARAGGKAPRLTIGAVLPLTGQYAEYGENVLGALQVAAEDIKRRDSVNVRIIAEDDQGEPSKAVSALQKLINADRVKFVIGGFTSSCSEAMYPIAEWNGVLLFSPSTSTPTLSEDTPLFFRNWPSDVDQARSFADLTLNRFGKKSASLLYARSEYGVDVKELFREAFEGLGGKVVLQQAYKPKATDLRVHVKRFQDNPADCIWLFGYYSEMGHFLKQAHELGLHVQFFGQEGIEAAQLLALAGEGAEGVIYFVPAFDPNAGSRCVRRFVSAFKAKLNREPDFVSAHAYDALHILADGIQAVGPDPKKVAEYLLKVKEYPGVAGLTTFDENGDAKKPLMVKTIKNGKFVPWKAP